MPKKGTLVTRVADDLRHLLVSGERPPGSKLPSEIELARTYSVSRPTIRAALRQLEAEMLVRTQHGVGTFVLERPAIHAGLERLESISESIRAQGHEPGMIYKSRVVRPLLPDEAKKMELPSSAEVLEVRRSILADDVVVAYSYDLIPLSVTPPDFRPDDLTGSLFAYMRDHMGVVAHHSVAQIHAVHSEHVGWDPADRADLYLLLDQLHYTADRTVMMYSRSYFVEGRYAFTVFRSI